MICGILHVDGQLTDARHTGELLPGEVELVAMPSDLGPWIYDATTKRAVAAPETLERRLAKCPISPGVLLALVFRLSASYGGASQAKKDWAAEQLNTLGRTVVAILNGL